MEPYQDDPRWSVAERVAAAARRRFPADVLAGADMTEVGAVLARQAEELAARGRPVDGTVDDLLAG